VRPYVDFLQLTDSVLGQPRLSPLLVVAEVRRRFGDGIRVRCNIRTRDHNLNSIIQLVASADTAGADGVLLVQGDRPRFGVGFNHGGAARVLAALRDAGFRDGRPKLYLTAPRSFSRSKLEEKIAARPDGLVTQPIGDLALVERFWEVLKPQGIELVVFVPIPSARNAEAAASLGFTWAVVDGDPVAYIGELRRRGVATLLSSPSSFADGFDVLRRLGARAVWART
jgi:5,10-methylenetetrahydrofolate reductase